MENKYIIFFLLIFYFFFQLSTLDYGTKVNDLDYIKNHYLDEKIINNFIEKKKIKENLMLILIQVGYIDTNYIASTLMR